MPELDECLHNAQEARAKANTAKTNLLIAYYLEEAERWEQRAAEIEARRATSSDPQAGPEAP